ncbi:ribonucleases P/MRP protein subunit pop7 [Allomyces javanicus]|nr:ribonucleases P/MRP protein subunit pop7 [Allomyces javanicus]
MSSASPATTLETAISARTAVKAFKRPRPPNEDKDHKRIKKNPVKPSPKPNDIYVTSRTQVRAYVARAIKLLEEMQEPFVTVHGLGKCIHKAVMVATTVERRSLGTLVLDVTTSTQRVVDELDYVDEDLEPELDVRSSSAIHIKISRKPSTVTLERMLNQAAGIKPGDDGEDKMDE